VGFLDDLKRQADAAKARQNTDVASLQRNGELADSACRSTFAYFNSLVQQLNVLLPPSKVVYHLDRQNRFDSLQLCDFRADARRKRLRGHEVYDHVVLRWRLRGDVTLALTKDFLPDIEQLESRLRQSGAEFTVEAVRDADNAKLREMRYAVPVHFQAAVLVTPDHDAGRVHFELTNLDGFETVHAEFAAFEVGTARLDELARWVVGERNSFLDKAGGIRRIEA
jgi:hypothetical protein